MLGYTTHVLARQTQPLHERCDRVVTKETLTQELPQILREGVPHDRRRVRAGARPENQAVLRRLAPEATLKPEVEGSLTVPNLLKVALKNEIEATEIAARWLVTHRRRGGQDGLRAAGRGRGQALPA